MVPLSTTRSNCAAGSGRLRASAARYACAPRRRRLDARRADICWTTPSLMSTDVTFGAAHGHGQPTDARTSSPSGELPQPSTRTSSRRRFALRSAKIADDSAGFNSPSQLTPYHSPEPAAACVFSHDSGAVWVQTRLIRPGRRGEPPRHSRWPPTTSRRGRARARALHRALRARARSHPLYSGSAPWSRSAMTSLRGTRLHRPHKFHRHRRGFTPSAAASAAGAGLEADTSS